VHQNLQSHPRILETSDNSVTREIEKIAQCLEKVAKAAAKPRNV
jgi:hypothetical protein